MKASPSWGTALLLQLGVIVTADTFMQGSSVKFVGSLTEGISSASTAWNKETVPRQNN